MGDAADDAREREADMLFDIIALRKNPFLEHRKRYSSKWMKVDGTVVKIKDMSTDHILNCIKLLDRADQDNTRAYAGLKKELLKRLII